MGKENIHQPVEVAYERIEACPRSNLQLSFFQIAYVISGSGFFNINSNRLLYRAGNLMLLTPNDQYHFTVDQASEFLFVKFNGSYVKEYQWKNINHMECLLYYATHLSGCILKNKPDEFLVKSIVDALLHGMQHNDVYHEDLTIHFVNALIVIAARNIAKIKPVEVKESADKRILDIIDYIQAHIYCPPKLTASAIAQMFGLSNTYLGNYFKNHCGETLQHYIAQYKLRLIEHRLKFSDRRINEIVDEFGFTDESHLNKFFKKHRNTSLTAYRKAQAIP